MSDTVTHEALVIPIQWDDGGTTHNWRNHVGEQVQAIWDTLTAVQKIAIARDAETEADREEWE